MRFGEHGSFHEVEQFEVVSEVDIAHEPVELERGAMRGTLFAYGNVEIGGEQRLILVTGERPEERLTEVEVDAEAGVEVAAEPPDDVGEP
ncbi:hypothetical protein [Nocardioides sp. AN3]